MEFLRRDAGLCLEPLLYRRPRMLERILPTAPGVGGARLAVMCGSYFSILLRGPKAHKEIGERSAIWWARNRTVKMFREWCEVRIHSTVLDCAVTPLEYDD